MVAFVDIDHFKVINDSMGHEWGDRVLCLVAERIKAAMRPSDTVARLGGDEFVVLCDSVPDERRPSSWPTGSAPTCGYHSWWRGHETFVTASIGLALAAIAVRRLPSGS